MRKTLLLTLVLCVVAAFAYAQTSAPAAAPPATTGTSTTTSTTTTPTGAATTTTTKTTGGKHHKAPAAKKYKGEVKSVDATAQSFVVNQATKTQPLEADITLKVNAKTKYYPKGKKFEDLKAGDNVWGTYKNDGTDNWALSVRWAKAPKAAAPPKTTGK
jgi:hypothetical protein